MISEFISGVLERLGAAPEIRDEPEDGDMDPWRDRIDQIDRILLALLNERSKAANIIGQIKKKLGVPVYAPRREEQVLDQVRDANKGPLPDSAVRHLFERIIDETRSLERHLSQDESDRSTKRTSA